ncbi:tRNA lysidine(34) synthetase TilS [Mariniflexile ostreae]|uniref:tRNA(Ile)-lysidine synthase n=1 Tax=Mariniflexile ostreae TaxID=1520892 RepID=A0ABV5F978_9FLAO
MLERFEHHINKNLPFLKEKKLLIAISGGMDSVILTHLCHKLKLKVALAHCNFNLRAEESDGDECFVIKLAEDLNLEVFVENFDTYKYAQDNKCSIQIACRDLRYAWFKELATQLNCPFILTAHHADDNLETFLINLTRGTGLEGLTGIPEINDRLVRPLLPFSSAEMKQFAKTNAIKWRNDSSNASTKYLRNKLRHDIIPILKEINPKVLQNFQNTISNLKETHEIVTESVDVFLSRTIENISGNEVRFKISEFKAVASPKAYLYEVFKEFGFTQWHDILSLLDAASGKQVFSSTYRLIKNREHLLLSKIHDYDSPAITISENDKWIETPFGMLVFDDAITNREKATVNKKHTVAYVDKALLKFPLTLRKWEEGDVFYPFGMSGKKKLSKYFKDEKLSILDKENVWLLCSGNDIVWVVNRRADNRFKVTENTRDVLEIQLKTGLLY